MIVKRFFNFFLWVRSPHPILGCCRLGGYFLWCYPLTLPIIAGYKENAIGFLKFLKVAQLCLLSDNLGYFSPTKKAENYS